MIMKLYIPTTTLNFNNILSSETISPKAFYGKRGYGYKRWESVAENGFENSILLYRKPFYFSRPANELDDYPMLIELEVDDEELAGFERDGDFVYKSGHSLTLTPSTARFIFFEEEHERIALSKSESSAETKLIPLYKDVFSVERPSEGMPINDVSDIEQLDYDALGKDKLLNKIKGFAYGYTIGRMLSRTEIGVKKLNARYNVRDIVASVISGGEGVVSIEQKEMLGKALLMFDNYYVPLLEKYGKDRADQDYLLLEEPSSGYYSNRKKWLSYQLKSFPVREKWEELQSWIAKAIAMTEAERAVDYSVLSVDGQAEIALMHGKLTAINSDLKYIDDYKMLVNDVFTSEKYNENVSVFRRELADDVAKKVMAEYGERWESSEIRTYLNAMRHYVAGEQFTQPWTDCVLSSITAVIMKGENWEGLFRFMVSKGMCDYRYAFGLYGALNGFANLTRDFIDILFAFENKKYTCDVYKEIHRQLTGVELKAEIKIVDLPLTDGLRESNVGKSSKSDLPNGDIQGVVEMLKGKGMKSLKGKKLEILVKVYNEVGGDIKETLGILKGVKGWQTYSERVLKDLEYSEYARQDMFRNGHLQAVEQKIDFNNEVRSDRAFYNDMNAYNYIYGFLNDAKEIKQVRIDLTYFQNNYKTKYLDNSKGEYVSGRYADKPKDNKSVLEHWENFLWRKKTKGKDWEKDIYAHIDIDKIMSELRKVYLK